MNTWCDVKEILLNHSQVALVDDADQKELSRFKWYASWDKTTGGYYAMRRENLQDGRNVTVYMHRQILGAQPGGTDQVDHKNHNTLDNRRDNLRIVTRSQNQWNQKSPKGYSWDKCNGKYKASISFHRHAKPLGYFDTPEEAHTAYVQAKEMYHNIA